jgi:hypothetical protein
MEWFTARDLTLARFLVQRGLGAIYALAFLNVVNQWRALLGEHGLLPVLDFVARVPFGRAPSLFHWRYSDRLALGLGWVGLALSLAVVAGVPAALPTWASMLWWLALWALYQSYVNVGQIWYAFGWESLLLEAGFLAIFLGADDVAPPLLILFLFRWLLFRVEFGAGLIKLRGDRCWRDLTCLEYHHETQPIPGPLSWFFHHLPRPLHRVETGANHVVQLGVPFLLFAPQPVAGIAACLIVVTQSWLVVSGNFAWLNAMTIVLAFSALPDAWLSWLPADAAAPPGDPAWWFVVVVVALTAGVAVLSRRPVRNLLSRHQRMNAAFDPLHLVNTYGAFGSVTKVRYEVEIEGTTAERPDADADWRAYGFRGKPGDPGRRPRQVAPYHLRLDWLMWFLAMSPSPSYRHAWFPALLQRLLEGDAATLRLLRHDPFAGERPRYVRARRFRYRYTTPAERRETGDWWAREEVGTFVGLVGRRTATRSPEDLTRPTPSWR